MADKDLAMRIIDLRESTDMTQTELAKRLHLSKSSMSKIESGTRKVSSDELLVLADIFNVTTDYLLGRTDSLNPTPTCIAPLTLLNLTDLPLERRKAVNQFADYQRYLNLNNIQSV